jgi:hypothetical protein
MLTEKEIKRGYYFTPNGVFSLEDCEVKSEYRYYNWVRVGHGYDESLRGKVTKPVNSFRMSQLSARDAANVVQVFIMFRGRIEKVFGWRYNMCLYFIELDGDCYRTKLQVTKNGYLIGRDLLESDLSEKMKKQCYNVIKEVV